jgi:hydroxymethylglutaryl-CoA synthase
MANTYDFYKPQLDSEYPQVDGPLSITTYLGALDASYARYREKWARVRGTPSTGSDPKAATNMEDFDYPIFHSPYCKLVQKGHARLFYNDFISNPDSPRYASFPRSLLDLSPSQSMLDKSVEKTSVSLASLAFKQTVLPGLACAKRCGNMYTASLYGALASVIASVEPKDLRGKRISVFAYGSGCASSFYAISVKGDTSEIREKMDLLTRLNNIKVVPCEEYVSALKVSKPAQRLLRY